MCVFQVILAYESIVLCKCSGKYIDIYFILKITYHLLPLPWKSLFLGLIVSLTLSLVPREMSVRMHLIFLFQAIPPPVPV